MNDAKLARLAILKNARARIAKGWCQGALAKDAQGNSIGYTHPKAVCWCAVGALLCEKTKDRSGVDYSSLVGALREQADPTKKIGLASANDLATQQDVLKWYDAVIEKMEKIA